MAMTAMEFIALMRNSEVPFLSNQDEHLVQQIRADISDVVGELLGILATMAETPGPMRPTAAFFTAAGKLKDKMEAWYKLIPPQRIRVFGIRFCKQMLEEFKARGVSNVVTECWVENMMGAYRENIIKFRILGWEL